jgi:energy-coupling factor transporter ATP-binding protein EcfA2
VLCQQVLSPEATERLQRFEAFVGDQAAKHADTTAAILADAVQSLTALQIRRSADVDRLLGEYGSLDHIRKTHHAATVEYIRVATERRTALLKAVSTGDWNAVPSLPASPAKELLGDAVTLGAEAARLQSEATDDGSRAAKRQRLAELLDQKKLSSELATVLERRQDLERLRRLKDCLAGTSTTGISRQVSKLRRELVTADLEQRIQQEIEALDLKHLPFRVQDESVRADSLFQVTLDATRPVPNNAVLSEGEQRALALACFLAEVAGIPAKHGIIIDDPVSSLDHRRIRKVAKRLVEEAATGRQVVVFTHNLVFYHEVTAAAAAFTPQVPTATHVIRSTAEKGFGLIEENDEPWVAKKITARIEILRKTLTAVKAMTDRTSDAYRRAVTGFYADLRESWERLVEEILFAGTVMRYNAEIKTQSLKEAYIDSNDYHTVFHAMKRASERSGHDMSDGRNIPLPEPEEMEVDLVFLDGYRDNINKRRKKIREEREALEKAPKASLV